MAGWRTHWRTFATLSAVALLGWVNLAMPFYGDQSLFLVGARSLARGATLYTDYWDFKQPGIYLFFRGAGGLFGFDENGVHLAEVLWLASWTGLAAFLLRNRWAKPAATAAFLAFALVLYQMGSQPRTAAQLEILVSPVLLVGILLVHRKRFLLGGLCGGLATLAKVVYAPFVLIPVVTWVVAKRRIAPAALPAALVTLGVVAPLAIAVVVLAAQGAAGELPFAWIEYPRRAVGELSVSRTRGLLVDMAIWVITRLGPLIVLAVAGLVAKARSKTVDRFYVDLWAVVALATLLNVLQLWWDYHFLILYAPLAVLAVDGAVAIPARAAPAVAAAAMLAVVPSVKYGSEKVTAFVTDDRAAYQVHLQPTYDELKEAAAVMREPGRTPGPIFVWGDPTTLYLTGRDQAGRLNGWSPEELLPEQWREIARQLHGEPVYLFVQDGYDALMPERSPETLAVIDEDFDVLVEVDAGTWYERVTP